MELVNAILAPRIEHDREGHDFQSCRKPPKENEPG
jgi:hypothetical protein